MIQVTSREFRTNQASIFAQADAGEQVVIRRRGKRAYMLIPVDDDDFIVTPALQARIREMRKKHKDGTLNKVTSHDELRAWLDSL